MLPTYFLILYSWTFFNTAYGSFGTVELKLTYMYAGMQMGSVLIKITFEEGLGVLR